MTIDPRRVLRSAWRRTRRSRLSQLVSTLAAWLRCGPQPTTASRSVMGQSSPQEANEANDLVAAASFIAESAQGLLTLDGRLHAETLIVSVARLSGSLLFRSFAPQGTLPVGAAVLSDQARSWGPQLCAILTATLAQLGEPPSEARIAEAVASVSTAASQLSLQESLDRLEPFVQRWLEVSQLDQRQGGLAAAMACGLLVHLCAAVIAKEQGAALAMAGFCEGLQTVPRLAVAT